MVLEDGSAAWQGRPVTVAPACNLGAQSPEAQCEPSHCQVQKLWPRWRCGRLSTIGHDSCTGWPAPARVVS